MEELSATISEIDSTARENAEASTQVKEKSGLAGEKVTVSHEKMSALTDAMSDILKGHQEISQIIETIENIAFQTNILALNAAVEAARYSSGKGFAVVADEVRNLAAKSDHAAKQTKEMIERSTKNVEQGGQLTGEVSAVLEETTRLVQDTVAFIDRVVSNIVSEAHSIDQVSEGVDQISSVVQTNSATAEESAAASEELSGQAQLLKELTGDSPSARTIPVLLSLRSNHMGPSAVKQTSQSPGVPATKSCMEFNSMQLLLPIFLSVQ
ncbi:methyl-accepting chemotaxis protein [Flavonifractor plautii]|nr:methyl-accepting chemotaxis protein [Flavonifractor plautii]